MGRDIVTDEYSPEETARRRDAVLKAMINTPPRPHKPLSKKKAERSKRLTAKATKSKR